MLRARPVCVSICGIGSLMMARPSSELGQIAGRQLISQEQNTPLSLGNRKPCIVQKLICEENPPLTGGLEWAENTP
jgi:hypothetical protein